MTRTFLRFAALAAVAMLPFAGCKGDKLQSYTVVSEIVLGSPELDMQNLSATVSAIYNGDDSGIDNAYFTVWQDGQDPSSAREVPCALSEGNASATVDGLEVGKDYRFNFVILTSGGNILTSETDGYLAFSKPHDFVFSTVNTVTAKILQLAYKGADGFIDSAVLVMKDETGAIVENVPEMHFYEGVGKALFVLDEWELALYTVHVEMRMYDGSVVETPEFRFSLMPLPETLTLSAVKIDGDVFNFSAAYDGEDNTIVKGYFTLYDKEGEIIDNIDADCTDRTATASRSGNEYGRYSVKCTLNLVDDSVLETEIQSFTYSRPRATEMMLLEPVPMGEAGMATSSEDAMAMNKFSYQGYDWEYQYMYARSSSSVTLYVSSTYSGFFMNSTPFENGIKTVYINHTSGKDPAAFFCYARTSDDADWVELDEAVKDGNTFIYDLSFDNYRYFKFGNKSKAEGGGELKADSFEIEYYTEAPEEY